MKRLMKVVGLKEAETQPIGIMEEYKDYKIRLLSGDDDSGEKDSFGVLWYVLISFPT
jgi:hypothetical protein